MCSYSIYSLLEGVPILVGSHLALQDQSVYYEALGYFRVHYEGLKHKYRSRSLLCTVV